MRLTKLQTEAIELYRLAAANAFGWAEILRSDEPLFVRSEPYSKEDGELWLAQYMAGHPTTNLNRPGSPLYLIDLAFRDMTISADRWEEWGYRLTAAHDYLLAHHPEVQQ